MEGLGHCRKSKTAACEAAASRAGAQTDDETCVSTRDLAGERRLDDERTHEAPQEPPVRAKRAVS